MEIMNVEKNLSNGVLVQKKVYIRPECQYIQIESEGMLCASGENLSGESDRFGGSFGGRVGR